MMAQPALVRVLAALTVVILVIFQTCEAQSVCYRAISHGRESYVTYRSQSYTTSYGCGWWRRCRKTNYRRQSVTSYRTRYSSQSRCCMGYQSCSSRCCSTNSHTSSLTRATTATQKTSLISSSSSHTPLLIPTQPNATLKTSKPSLVLSSLIKSSSTFTSHSTDSRLDVSTSTVLSLSPALGMIRDPMLQSSYSFLSTDLEPAPGILLTGVLSVVGILSIAAVITVVVLIVVIRRRKKAAMTVKNGSVQTHDVQKVPKSNETTNPNNGTTNTDGLNTDERVLHNPVYGAPLNLQDRSASAEPTDERVLHNPMYGFPLNVQDRSTSAEPTDERVLHNPMYGSPLNLQDGSNGVPLYNSVNVKDSSLMHIYEGIANTTPGVSDGSYNSRHSPEPYEAPVPHIDRSAMPAATVPETGEYSQVAEPSNAKPEENGKDHDDYSHLRH